ncbi:MAG: THUMP domain-containing protein [Thermoplasmata archaeon]
MPRFLIRYGEIALKSNWVRRKFQDRLVTNIQDYFLHRGVECMMRSEYGRIYLDTDEIRHASEILSRIFGITSFSVAETTSSDMEDIAQVAIKRFRSELKPGKKFAVRTRRTGDHKYTSQELASYVGRAIQSRIENLEVDLSQPDIEVFIEVRGKGAYVFSERIPAPGGMPLGTQGAVLAVVDSSEGLVGAWLMMKRGCKVHISRFDESETFDPLRNWDIRLKAYSPDSWSDLDPLIDKSRCQGFVTTWEDRDKYTPAKGIPVFYPTIGLSKEELDNLLKRIRE